MDPVLIKMQIQFMSHLADMVADADDAHLLLGLSKGRLIIVSSE